MLELKREELFNIKGGASISTLPNFRAYVKLFSWIYKTICSWFFSYAYKAYFLASLKSAIYDSPLADTISYYP